MNIIKASSLIKFMTASLIVIRNDFRIAYEITACATYQTGIKNTT